jgi:4-nitrophenyl phosphatase
MILSPNSKAPIRALILDMDGTLMRGDAPMPGFRNLFKCLDARQIPFIIATNNATKSPLDYQAKLNKHDANINAADVLTAGSATAVYLQTELESGSSLFVIGETVLREALLAAGFIIKPDAAEGVDAVVVGGDYSLTYEKLKNAALLLQRGARFVGTNPDVLFPSEEGLVPETGTTLAALQAATSITPTVVGKPERYLFDLAVEQMGSDPSRTAMVGDRLETDIIGGKHAKLKTILITTGVDNDATVLEKGIHPDWIVDGLEDLIKLIT